MTVLLVPGWVYVPDTGVTSAFSLVFSNLFGWFTLRFPSYGSSRDSSLGFEELKRKLYEQLSKRIPGMASYLNIICRMTYRVDCISLLFTSPTKLFHVVLNYHGGDFHTACYVFKIVFLNPLAEILGKPELSDRLLELVKFGKDEDFLKTLSAP